MPFVICIFLFCSDWERIERGLLAPVNWWTPSRKKTPLNYLQCDHRQQRSLLCMHGCDLSVPKCTHPNWSDCIWLVEADARWFSHHPDRKISMGGRTERTGAYQERLCNILHKSTSYKYGGELNNKSVVCCVLRLLPTSITSWLVFLLLASRTS